MNPRELQPFWDVLKKYIQNMITTGGLNCARTKTIRVKKIVSLLSTERITECAKTRCLPATLNPIGAHMVLSNSGQKVNNFFSKVNFSQSTGSSQ
jgi:hypothetical protein